MVRITPNVFAKNAFNALRYSGYFPGARGEGRGGGGIPAARSQSVAHARGAPSALMRLWVVSVFEGCGWLGGGPSQLCVDRLGALGQRASVRPEKAGVVNY